MEIFTTEVTKTTENRKATMGASKVFSVYSVPSVLKAFAVNLAAEPGHPTSFRVNQLCRS
jgi:hypothetical protein